MDRQKDKKRWLMALAVAVLLLAGLAVSWKPKEAGVRVIMVSKSSGNATGFWKALTGGAQMAAEEYDAEYELMAPAREVDYKEQNQLIEAAIEKKPDAIVLSPADYDKTLPFAEKIKAAGIKLVLVDSQLGEALADSVVCTDNYEAGRRAGEYLASICKEDVSIGIVSHVKGSSTAQEREKGIRDGLKEKSGAILMTVYGESSYSLSYDAAKKMITEHPDINVIAATNEYATVGAARLVKDMGLKDKVKIVGFDSSTEEIQMVEAGIVEGIVIQRPFEMGYLGIRTAVELVQGTRAESSIDSGFQLITRGNIFTEENQKLLFPVWSENKSE